MVLSRRAFLATGVAGGTASAFGQQKLYLDDPDRLWGSTHFGADWRQHTGGFWDGVDEASKPVMEAARRGIERIRKRDFELRITGPDGQPASGEIEIQHVEHEFQFGVNISGVPGDGPRILPHTRQTALEAADELFSIVRVGAHMSSQAEPGGPYRFDRVDRDVAWAKAHGKAMRYHSLIYQMMIPAWHWQVRTEAEWWPIMERYIAAVADRYGDDIHDYDAINEMVSNVRWRRDRPRLTFPPLHDPLISKRVIELCRKHLPDAVLVSLEDGWPADENGIWRAIYEFQKDLVATDAPFDAIGTQCHFYTYNDVPFQAGHPRSGPGAFTMASIGRGFDLLGSLGKPVFVPEHNPPSRNNNFWWTQPRLTDEEIASWTENFYTLAFSKPYIKQLVRWFLIDNVQGRGMDAGIVAENGGKKPVYYALRKLLKQTWSTHWQGTPDASGAVSIRGYHGTYEAKGRGFKPARFVVAENGPRRISVALKPS